MLVAQSLGGFTAPLVAERLPVSLIVLVAAMVPAPGESPGEWWVNTGHVFPDPFDPMEVFLHDLPGVLVRTGRKEESRAKARGENHGRAFHECEW